MAPFARLVVLNYNAGPLLARCVESVLALDWPADRREVVVIDNGSTDGSFEHVAATFGDRVRRLTNPAGNTGFSANNLAFGDLGGVDYVGLINPDSNLDPDWLRHLVAALDADPGLGAACPRITLDETFAEWRLACTDPLVISGARMAGGDVSMHVAGGEPLPGEDGTLWVAADGSTLRIAVPVAQSTAQIRVAARRTVTAHVGSSPVVAGPTEAWVDVEVAPDRVAVLQHAGAYRLANGNCGDIGWLSVDDETWDTPTEVDGWCGASVLLRSAYLADVGGFDERFFLYYEDADLSWRGARRGWRYRYVPAARSSHHQSATVGVASPLAIRHQWRNRLRMVRKNGGRTEAVRATIRASASLVRTCGQALGSRPASLRSTRRRQVRARLHGSILSDRPHSKDPAA